MRNNAKRFKYNKPIEYYLHKSREPKLMKKTIYVLDVKLDRNSNKKIQLHHDNDYVSRCFDIAFDMLREKITYKFLEL